MSPVKLRRDPAPSLLSYRLGRLWLTPSFRRLITLGPWVTLVLGLMLYAATSNSFKSAVAEAAQSAKLAVVGREEFQINTLAIFGASPRLEEEVRAALNMDLPISSLELDLAALRGQIEALPRVSVAAVRVGGKGALQINLTERQPEILWRSDGAVRLMSRDGVELGRIGSRLDRPDLPLVAGAGAGDHLEEALDLFAQAAGISDRVRGLQRVGARRWSVILDRDQKILLPSKGALGALGNVVEAHGARDILNKDVSVIDMRIPARPIIRLRPEAAAALWAPK